MSLFERSTAETPLLSMPLWERYLQCRVTPDPTELILIIDQFKRVMLTDHPRIVHALSGIAIRFEETPQ